jgi:hypothetical protein
MMSCPWQADCVCLLVNLQHGNIGVFSLAPSELPLLALGAVVFLSDFWLLSRGAMSQASATRLVPTLVCDLVGWAYRFKLLSSMNLFPASMKPEFDADTTSAAITCARMALGCDGMMLVDSAGGCNLFVAGTDCCFEKWALVTCPLKSSTCTLARLFVLGGWKKEACAWFTRENCWEQGNKSLE